ncbi:MAG: 6-bladed beta-propeller [Chloroflexi bacterium]|nr:6-bladed beta-propeller [Chloroflexota bacterium]
MNTSTENSLLSATLVFAAIVALVLALHTAHVEGAPFAPAQEGVTPKASPPAGVDLDVTFINRAPLYKAYCVEYPWDVPNQPGIPFLCPDTENDRRWPEPGEIVTFTAHIINKGTVASPPFDFAWYIDGAEVARGTLPSLASAAEVTTIYRWPWAHGLSPDGQRALGEHTVRFTADPADAVAETFESNNALEDRTDAMSFSIYLPPDVYDAYDVPADPRWPWSAEDWLQKQIATMNAAFANSIYPVTPQGATVRVRINTIGVTATHPGPDGAHDGSWYLTDDVRCDGCGYYDAATDIDWGLVHELSHQGAIIDMYAIGVYAANVTVLNKDGLPANVGFGWNNGGLMGGGDTAPHNDPHLYDSHSAGGASTFSGYRNGYFGAYLFDIPLDNYVRVLDSTGNPAPGVTVALYQRTGPWDPTGHMEVDNIPEISGITDANGVFRLPNRSANGGTVTANGHVMHDNPFGVVDIIGNQGLFLMRLATDGHEEFHWLDITQFNLAYWSGDTISHTFTIASHVPPPAGPAAPELLSVRIEGLRARLDWLPSPSPGVVGYRVYRAAAPQYRYVAASGVLTATHFEEDSAGFGDGEHRIYAVTAVDGQGRESGFGELAYAPGLEVPAAVALAPDGSRTVLNNWNMYPLLRQRTDGRFTHRLVNVHYDLGNVGFLAYDPAGLLLVSGFGESPFGRHAVRVYDSDLRPLTAFGDEGTAPGQFQAPAGVASWGQTCTYGGPYQADAHTLLLLHLDGTVTGAQGEPGTAHGASFAASRYGQGVLVDDGDTLTYAAAGNIDATQGAVEFWLRPDWAGDDGSNHTLFWWGEGSEFLHLRKDGISNLVFDRFYADGSCGAPHHVADWRAGEWHHLAFTWQGTEMRLYEDGQEVARTECGGIARPTASIFYVGSGMGGELAVDALIDELRISDMPRLGNSETCNRLLVADSGNHRVQAFDSLGRFVSAFGTFGSGPGRFNNPQGLVVDSNGRVIVVDQGNNRLVVLGFDGQAFGFLDSFIAGFNAPTGVAADAWGNLAVADTGNHRVVVLSPEGDFLAQFTAPNDGYSGTFNTPRGVAVEPDGNLVVADTGNHRVVTVRDALPGCWRIWLPVIIRR